MHISGTLWSLMHGVAITRFYHENPPACAHLCNSSLELELTDIFTMESLSFAPPGVEVKEVFPTLYLLGNMIYMKSNFCDAAGWAGLLLSAICMGG